MIDIIRTLLAIGLGILSMIVFQLFLDVKNRKK
jgi:hypothetical protein